MTKAKLDFDQKKYKKLSRILIPGILIIIWLVASSFGGQAFSKINNVANNNEQSFLPKSSQATEANNLLPHFVSINSIPAILLFINNNRINSTDLAYLKDLKPQINKLNGVIQSAKNPVVGPIIAKDQKAAEFIIPTESNFTNSNVDSGLKNLIKTRPNDLTAYVTGEAGILSAFSNAFKGINGILTYVAVAAVLIVLLLVYRSLLLPFLVLLNSVFALTVAIFVVYNLALHNVVQLNGESQGILSILVIGASTDYSILIVSRLKEALHKQQSTFNSVLSAIKAAWEPITAAASTVIISLFALLFDSLNSTRSLGPVAAIGIIASYLSAMTLLPAILAIFGRKAFWPLKIRVEQHAEDDDKSRLGPSKVWNNIAKFIDRRHRLVWISLSLILLVLAVVGINQYKATGVTQSQSILGSSSAVTGQNLLGNYFPAGSGTPVEILTSVHKYQAVLAALNNNPVIASSIIISNSKTHQPIVYQGLVLINSTLNANAQSQAALSDVANLRSSINKIDPSSLIGGATAVQLDVNNADNHDLKLTIPIVLVIIFIILGLLLRSILAPIYLVLTVILSYSAAIGTSALFFNHVFNFPGADPSITLFGFIFLVALGIDYNIFLMSRIREEALIRPTREAVLKGLSVTGSVITSAGLVLAVTFAALGVIPILFLAQIAFIVAFGVLLDTMIVRSFIVPALSIELGRIIWWPFTKKVK